MILSNTFIFLIIVTTASAGALAATSISVRHHWEDLFCSNILLSEPLEGDYKEQNTANAAVESRDIKRNSSTSDYKRTRIESSDSTLLTTTTGGDTDALDRVGTPGNVLGSGSSASSKRPNTPCKNMQAKYGVITGASWGTMPDSEQR